VVVGGVAAAEEFAPGENISGSIAIGPKLI
jgi:hypothetical protein